MRIKDRNGPGIVNCETGRPPSSAEGFAADEGWVALGEGWSPAVPANRSPLNSESVASTHRYTGDFMGWTPLGVGRTSLNLECFAEGRGVFNSRNENAI